MKHNGSSMTIDPLNAELAKKNVYSKLVQKQVTSWAHIRNKAAHGEYDEYSKEQVQMMLLFVQGFAGQHLS
jgi:flagellar biosynthesis chaperone FliJ